MAEAVHVVDVNPTDVEKSAPFDTGDNMKVQDYSTSGWNRPGLRRVAFLVGRGAHFESKCAEIIVHSLESRAHGHSIFYPVLFNHLHIVHLIS